MKDNPAYENVRFFDSNTDIPNAADYILRQKNESEEVVFEQSNYSKEGKIEGYHVITTFTTFDISKVNIEETLRRCRIIIGSTKVLWVEKPAWMAEESSKKIKIVS